ncbi:uncharacterized protein [Elaeis guineensis]|uniref:WD repeat-containing protein 44 n=1 Tax=Elaeis guineensis var. tenera TaxID=51953 RepID=A0A6I9S093_ELAGV|nr:WD repeat-containing protein 44 [Elaeis guineensis]
MRTSGAATPVAAAEEEEEFYESLDRILSSSCSSTSASDDDADHHHHRRVPRFPLPIAASYDLWISEPSSIEERRRRLLHQMGLAADPALSRSLPAAPDGGDGGIADVGRSVLADGLCPRPNLPAAVTAVFTRSRSDGSVDPSPAHRQQPFRTPLSFGTAIPNKPPLGRRPWPTAGERGESGGKDDGGGADDGERRCTIKNLDDGREFVVKEFREDGMWNKLREVGTGRQLTMEEFEMCVGRSPIVQELMRRQNVEELESGGKRDVGGSGDPGGVPMTTSGAAPATKSKKRGGWLKTIKNMAGTVVAGGYYQRERRNSDEKDSSSERGGRRSSSATDDSLDASHSSYHCPERIRVRQYGKSFKELTGLYMSQEIHAHNGSIWSIKFSLDGRYLASAGVDCVIHVWEVSESERKVELLTGGVPGENGNCYPFFTAISNGSPEPALALACVEGNYWEKKRRAKVPSNRKSVSMDHLMVPERIFTLSEKPVCSFRGHLDDVLDLSWSKSQHLLSSSMDKTVRLWHISSNSCLKTFSHSDYVTCIQFNPVDDRYFISGSLDEKVRIWSIPDRQVVDWNDLHEMVTAACFTPDGQGALVGSHKGSCYLFDTSENKLHYKSQIDLQIKKKKSSPKKITGFQFAPGSSSEVLVTSADSRIRVVNGVELVHKFKGFRNTSSQISASLAANGKYVVCASEDSHVYVWRYDADTQPSRSKGVVGVTQSYEHFNCQDVTVAVTWPGTSTGRLSRVNSHNQNGPDGVSKAGPGVLAGTNEYGSPFLPVYECNGSSLNSITLDANSNNFSDRASATWPEEKLTNNSPQSNGEFFNEVMRMPSRSAWGMVIVTAGGGGEIRTFQNFGFPLWV